MGREVAITRTDLSSSDLRRRSSKAGDAGSARRMLAIALVMDGVDRKTAAETCGMDRQTLRDWVHRYNAEGLAGLVNRKSPGAPRLLNDEQKAQLAKLLDAGPQEGDRVVRWRWVDLRGKIKDMFGVEMHERTVGKQLAALGYVRLSVRPQHPKANQEAQDAFKKTSSRR